MHFVRYCDLGICTEHLATLLAIVRKSDLDEQMEALLDEIEDGYVESADGSSFACGIADIIRDEIGNIPVSDVPCIVDRWSELDPQQVDLEFSRPTLELAIQTLIEACKGAQDRIAAVMICSHE